MSYAEVPNEAYTVPPRADGLGGRVARGCKTLSRPQMRTASRNRDLRGEIPSSELQSMLAWGAYSQS